MKEEQKCVLDNSIEWICVHKTSTVGLLVDLKPNKSECDIIDFTM